MPLPADVADLTGYDLLLSVAESGSIGRAARLHGVSQPAASARLSQLERRTGVLLLERSPRGATLTTSGRLVADWARHAIDAAAKLEAGIAALKADRDGHLRVAASLTVADYLMPRWLVTLRTTEPGIVAALTSGNSTEVADDVRAGRAELGFVEGPRAPAGMRSKVVATDELAVVVAPTHPWARRRRPLAAAELAATGLISREPGSGTRQALEDAIAARTDVPSAEPLVELSSTTAIKAAAAQGLGPAILSARAVAAELAAGTLVTIRVSDVDLRRRLRAIWPAGRKLTGPAGQLLAIAARSGD